MPEPVSLKDPVREDWVRASRATLGASVVLVLLSRGQKAVAGDFLKAVGVDWSALNPYAIGLFGVPVLAVLCAWTLWWARAFALTRMEGAWHERVATKIKLTTDGGSGRSQAAWSLVLYVVLPIAALAALLGKFLNGSFYFLLPQKTACLEKDDCLWDRAGIAHFRPPQGVQSIWHTPYRYEGNLTYLPPWQAIAWVAVCLAVAVYAASYAGLLMRRRADPQSPGQAEAQG